MRLTINQALEAIQRNETPEDYIKRLKKLKKLTTERDFLIDAIEILQDDPRADEKKKRLKKVLENINKLK